MKRFFWLDLAQREYPLLRARPFYEMRLQIKSFRLQIRVSVLPFKYLLFFEDSMQEVNICSSKNV